MCHVRQSKGNPRLKLLKIVARSQVKNGSHNSHLSSKIVVGQDLMQLLQEVHEPPLA